MSDVRTVLERGVRGTETAPAGLERMLRRRDRKRRNQRVTAAAASLVIAVGATGWLLLAFRGGSASTPSAGDLTWVGSVDPSVKELSGHLVTSLAVAGDRVYALATPKDSDVTKGCVLVAFDPDGHRLWSRSVGVSPRSFASAIAADASGVYVVGSIDRGAKSGGDVIVRKYSADGTQAWKQTLRTSRSDVGTTISVTGSGVYVGGTTNGALPFHVKHGRSGFIARLSLDGTQIWTVQLPDRWVEQVVASSSGIYATGYQAHVSNGYGAFLDGFNDQGRLSWHHAQRTRGNGPNTQVSVDESNVYWTIGSGVDVTRTYGFGGILRRQEPLDPVGSVPPNGANVRAFEGAVPRQVEGGHGGFVGGFGRSGQELWSRRLATLNNYAWSIGPITQQSGVAYVAGYSITTVPGSRGVRGAFVAAVSEG